MSALLENWNALNELRTPSDQTLRKYGLSLSDWMELYTRKGGCCHICGRSLAGKRANVDHEHVLGWKKMPPEERKTHIRGLLCYQCNKFMVMRGITSEKLYQGWQYMRAWEVRVKPTSGNVDPTQDGVKRRNVRHSNQKQDKKHQTG